MLIINNFSAFHFLNLQKCLKCTQNAKTTHGLRKNYRKNRQRNIILNLTNCYSYCNFIVYLFFFLYNMWDINKQEFSLIQYETSRIIYE